MTGPLGLDKLDHLDHLHSPEDHLQASKDSKLPKVWAGKRQHSQWLKIRSKGFTMFGFRVYPRV